MDVLRKERYEHSFSLLQNECSGQLGNEWTGETKVARALQGSCQTEHAALWPIAILGQIATGFAKSTKYRAARIPAEPVEARQPSKGVSPKDLQCAE